MLGKVRKELAGRFYQLLSGHATTAVHFRRVGQVPRDRCWWCGSGERQTHHHLLIRCRRWTPEIKRMWQRVERGCEWEPPRPPSVRLLFRDERATPAPLEFLADTRVGRMPGLALFGVEERSQTWRRLRCRPRRMRGRERRAKRVGLAHPRMYFSFVSFLCLICVSSGDEG